MKLDQSVVGQIKKLIAAAPTRSLAVNLEFKDLFKYLENLDLVIKPGDSSQGTLVENK